MVLKINEQSRWPSIAQSDDNFLCKIPFRRGVTRQLISNIFFIMLLFLSTLACTQNEKRDLTDEEWYFAKDVGGNLTIGCMYYFLDSVSMKTIFFYNHSQRFKVVFEGKYRFDNNNNELYIEYDTTKTKLPADVNTQIISRIKDKKTDYFKLETINDSIYNVYHTNNWVGGCEFDAENEISCISFLKKETTKEGYYLSNKPQKECCTRFTFIRKNSNKKI